MSTPRNLIFIDKKSKQIIKNLHSRYARLSIIRKCTINVSSFLAHNSRAILPLIDVTTKNSTWKCDWEFENQTIFFYILEPEIFYAMRVFLLLFGFLAYREVSKKVLGKKKEKKLIEKIGEKWDWKTWGHEHRKSDQRSRWEHKKLENFFKKFFWIFLKSFKA